jgi:ribokinase
MAKRAAISGYATLDFIVRSADAPQGAGTYRAEILDGPAWPRAGGAPLYAGRRLAAGGVIAAPLVAVGDDANSAAYRKACLEAGLSLDAIALGAGRTPSCILIHHAGGGCTCFLDPGAVDGGLTEAQGRQIDQAELLCVAAGPQTLTRAVLSRARPDQTLAWIAKADEACFPLPLAEALAARADVIFCNAGERTFVERARRGPSAGQVLIETRGGDGVVVEAGSNTSRYAVIPIAAHDATGAGDTFAGEFLALRLAGAPLDEAIKSALEAARALMESRRRIAVA